MKFSLRPRLALAASVALLVCGPIFLRGQAQDVPAYRNPKLPIEQRRAVLLAAMYGRTAAEIAKAEAIPLGTAKTRIRMGMAKLREAVVIEELQ